MWQTPITNWSSNNYANYTDFNRIENNTQEIQNQLSTYLTPLTLQTIVTNRTNADMPYADVLNKIESNIQTLKVSFGYTHQGFFDAKTWAPLMPFDYNDMNRLEGNLSILYSLVINTIADLEYCGKAVCGADFYL